MQQKHHSINEICCSLIWIIREIIAFTAWWEWAGAWAGTFPKFPFMHPIKRLALEINHHSHWTNRIHSLCHSSELIRWVISAFDRVPLNSSFLCPLVMLFSGRAFCFWCPRCYLYSLLCKFLSSFIMKCSLFPDSLWGAWQKTVRNHMINTHV